ncbi:MAG: hypothetical protein IKB34_08665 [Clostridia bacterium]|nr:hypothetical protein [Clostridia bacterium]
MKITDAITEFGEACRKVTLSLDYDNTAKLTSSGRVKPYLVWHTEGSFGIKIVKLAASAAIVAGIAAVSSSCKSAKNKNPKR